MPWVATKHNELDNLRVRPYMDAFSFTATANSTSQGDYKFLVNMYITSIDHVLGGGNAGDYVVLQVVDVDNILGNGADTVVGQPIKKHWINPTADFIQTELAYPIRAYKNLYLRVKYTNTNVLATVAVRINVNGHEDLTNP